jgi:Na+/proline symporter
MSPGLILACIGGYFGFLLLIAWVTSRNATNAAYFLGNKASPWYAVAFGMIGDSLSGVTFISVPGWVGTSQFSYLQMVFGYVVGYAVIAGVLLPLYYRLNLTSIYSYLRERFGSYSQKTGSAFFLLSRTVGAAARLYLAAGVIQAFVFDAWRIPFALTVAVIIGLMLLYTFKGGIRTLVWTDTYQSTFLLLGLILSIVAIGFQLDLSPAALVTTVRTSPHAQIFFRDWLSERDFWKQFAGGAVVAICMTGLDQNMMQKNLSCRSLADAQKNIYWFSIVVVFVNLLFLSLGALLYHYARTRGIAIPDKTDELFPLLALQHLGVLAAIVFVIGLTAATFSSADSVLTTLTTSFCIDILSVDRNARWTDARKTALRHWTHAAFAVVLLGVILIFNAVNSPAVIQLVLKLANYTYGPLLGLFAFGLFCRRTVLDRSVPFVCLLAPLVCYVLDRNSEAWFGGYRFGNELLVLNGLFTCTGLLFVGPSRKEPEQA